VPAPEEGAHELFEDPSFIETYLEREPLFERFLSPVIDEVRRVVAPPARLVDVGANVGTLVRLAGEVGYEAIGLELNEAGVAFAQGRGLDVRAVTLEDAGFADGSIDAITMSAVAEHLHDLDGTFATCHRLLRPGGALVAANSPNIRSLAWLLERERWYGLQPQGHPWQFTPATLAEILERNGFRLVACRTFGMHRDFGRNRKQRLKRAALRAAEHLGFGDALTLVAVRI
jgi:SAM-dependent methyltransferase